MTNILTQNILYYLYECNIIIIQSKLYFWGKIYIHHKQPNVYLNIIIKMNNVLYNNMSHQQLKSTVFIHSQGLLDSGLIQENLQGILETFNIIFTSFNHVPTKTISVGEALQ